VMRRLFVCVLAVVLAVPAFAVDSGRAEGSLTTGNGETPLAYAYVMNKSQNDLSNRKDAFKIVLTDKPLPAGTKLSDVDYNFPDGILGVVVCVGKDNQPLHLVVQHAQGTYDGGWMDFNPDVHVRMKRNNDGSVEGRLTCKKAEKPSVTFAFDAAFQAMP
jgi:hypothetical protein